jgi:hypothetical protein
MSPEHKKMGLAMGTCQKDIRISLKRPLLERGYIKIKASGSRGFY